MNNKLYENIIKGIQKGVKQSILNENSDRKDIFSSVKDNSYIEVLNDIKEECYAADKNHIHNIQGIADKYWDIAEIVIGNSKQYGEIWTVSWNSNMNGHYKSRVNCKDISEYVLYSIAITYKDESDHTYTLYFGDDYLEPDYMKLYKTQRMTLNDIYSFYEYIEKLVWESQHQDIADSWREDERNQSPDEKRKYQEKVEKWKKERQERLEKEEEHRKIVKMQTEWKEKMTDLIYQYVLSKLSRRKSIIVDKSTGSTQAEGNVPYTAIAFYKDKKGPIGYIGRIKVNYHELDLAVPLCGHSYMKLSEENYKGQVDYCIEFMLN